MAKGFSIMDLMNEMSREGMAAETAEKVSVFDIQPNPKNEYELSEIEKIKDSIYALGGVQQNLVLVKLPESAEYKYLALDGHRRHKASMELVQEGYPEFELVPAVIKADIDAGIEDAMLVMLNSTQRNKTDWEKVMEHMRLKDIIPKLKKRQKIDGRTRSIEADYLGVSQGQIAIYNTIGTRLSAELMERFKAGSIGISLAYEAAKLEPDMQKQLAGIAENKGDFTDEDIRQISGSRPMEGQLKIAECQVKNQSVMLPQKNVTESGTFEKLPEKPEPVPEAEKKKICYTNNESDVDDAIEFIFCMYDFPEDKLQELINLCKQGKDGRYGFTAQRNIFDKMLPYENSNVKVVYKMGYQVEYVHMGEIVKIPIYDFWKGFERKFEWNWKQGTTKQTTETAGTENVTESDTFEESPAAGDGDDMEKTKGFRGGYEPVLIDDLIREYESYLEIALPERIKNQICKYNCLLDALELLKTKMEQETECTATAVNEFREAGKSGDMAG